MLPLLSTRWKNRRTFNSVTDLREDAQFFGICFKRWAYAAGDGTRIAPLVLSKTANWEPRPVEQPVELPSWPVTSLTLIVLGVVATAIAWYIHRTTVFKHADVERARGYMSHGVDHLKDEEIPSFGGNQSLP